MAEPPAWARGRLNMLSKFESQYHAIRTARRSSPNFGLDSKQAIGGAPSDDAPWPLPRSAGGPAGTEPALSHAYGGWCGGPAK